VDAGRHNVHHVIAVPGLANGMQNMTGMPSATNTQSNQSMSGMSK
jgi:hypothetical protein